MISNLLSGGGSLKETHYAGVGSRLAGEPRDPCVGGEGRPVTAGRCHQDQDIHHSELNSLQSPLTFLISVSLKFIEEAQLWLGGLQ